MKVVLAMATLLAPLAVAVPASAATTQFQTPSGNIFCDYYAGELRCDLISMTTPEPRKPASCDGDYGRAFGITRTGRGQRLCISDSVADPGHPVLAYGRTLRIGGIVCSSTRMQLRCVNRRKHGFALSRSSQRVF